MAPVGGSRHYQGGGLGPEGGWDCPSCGAENMGPMVQGCAACGAGRPGRHIGTTPPPPPPAPPPVEATAEEVEQLGPFDRWALSHQGATLEQAYTAGYMEGIKMGAQTVAQAQARQAATEPIAFTAVHIINRTMVAALTHFRDHVLSGDPEETTTGEWLTQHQTSALIHQIQTYIQQEEGVPAHA